MRIVRRTMIPFIGTSSLWPHGRAGLLMVPAINEANLNREVAYMKRPVFFTSAFDRFHVEPLRKIVHGIPAPAIPIDRPLR